MRRPPAALVFLLVAAASLARAEIDGADAAAKTAAGFRVPDGFKVEVFAADPQLYDPVALCLDEHGRVYIAEEHRFNEGTEENRTRPYLLDDDLQVNTLEDRLAMFKKWESKFDGGLAFLTRKSDIVRRLEDRDGDGKADTSNVFADGFDAPLDGIGAGLIARDGKVWYTCIPNLWLLEDKDADGVAEAKTALLRGFGVNAAFLGHDLHGLAWGPDGRLYFSVGDRGAHVVTQEGTTISNPRTGAVYRCHPDGSGLELIHRGLRNPQELAFDQFGNLFADDNNCDKGDDSRLVYVVPGGDSGWNMAFQSLPDPYLTGPWHAEAMWHLAHELQPAFIVPPVGKLGAGPSGFVFTSGTSLPPRYGNHFFYCNYTGNGGIESFAVQPDGASFAITDHHDFCKPVMASDVDFGYDGKLYVAEYNVSPFDRSTSGGRVYTIFDPAGIGQPVVEETRALFQDGFGELPPGRLLALLRHDDLRVRLRAQFALAARGAASIGVLENLAAPGDHQLARLHAIWGLGQLGRDHPEALRSLPALLADADSEIRAQASRVLGEARYSPATEPVLRLLADPSSRVRFFAAIAAGSMQTPSAIAPLFELLRANDGHDRYLRHAGVVALEQIGDREAVQQRASDSSAEVRLAVLLIQRRWSDPRLAQFLDDAELKIVTEAARAINDLPLPAGLAPLAALADRYHGTDGTAVAPLMRRIINANFQLGARPNADAVVAVATMPNLTPPLRAEALAALADWAGPAKRDRVTGFWHAMPARDATPVRDAVQQAASHLLLAADSAALQTQTTELFTALHIETNDQTFAAWVADPQRPEEARRAALHLLAARQSALLPASLDAALASDRPPLRAAARGLLATTDPARATPLLLELLDAPDASVFEKQSALQALARLDTPDARSALDRWADRLRRGAVPSPLQLEVIAALGASTNNQPIHLAAIREFEASGDPADPLAAYRACLQGGDAAAGRAVFTGHPLAQCVRCHRVGGKGGVAGPDLTHVAAPARHADRRALLESIVNPNAKIAAGFGSVALTLTSGKTIAGTVQAEDAVALTLLTPDNESVRVALTDIHERTATVSAMPPMATLLTRHELRDLIEYLASLK